MTLYDDYFTNDDKPFAENINDALLLSNVFNFTVPISLPTDFSNSTWVDSTSPRKASVGIVQLKESLPSGISVSTSDDVSVLTGTGTVKLLFYPNFNSFGKIKAINWTSENDKIQVNLKTKNGTTIATNIANGTITSSSTELRTLQQILIEIIFTASDTLTGFQVVMENKVKDDRHSVGLGMDSVVNLNSTINGINEEINSIWETIYPIGSIYMSVNSTSPATLFGGTWEQIKDRFLLSAGSTYSAGAIGGSATVSLTQSQMPRHTHIQNSHTHTQNAHSHNFPHYSESGTETVYSSSWTRQKSIADNVVRSATATNQSTTATNKYAGGSGSAQSESNGSAHENMPPYLTVYVWQRTA